VRRRGYLERGLHVTAPEQYTANPFPPYVPTDRVDRFRVLDERAMADTCDIVHTEPGTINPDGSGEPGEVVVTTVPCRFLDAGGAAEILAVWRLTVQANGILWVPVSTVATEEDTVTFKGDRWQIVGTSLGQTYATSLQLAVKLEE
jgi:hypothetical protein